MSLTKTHTGAEQARVMGLDKPLYNEYSLGDLVKLQHRKSTYKIGWITGGGTLIYVNKQNVLGGFSETLEGPFWMSEIDGCDNY
jgi:hypothetical protein